MIGQDNPKHRFGSFMKYLPKSTANASDGKKEGEYPFFTSSVEQNKWTDNYLYDDNCLIIGNGGVANIQYYSGKFSTGSHSFVTKAIVDFVSTKYVYLYFYSDLSLLEAGFRGVGIKNISKEFINDLMIPIPEMEVQNRIIHLYDQSDKSKFELEQALNDLTATYKRIITENLG